MTKFVEVQLFDRDVPISFDRELVSGFHMLKEGGTRIFLVAPELTGPCGFIDTPEDYRYVKAAMTDLAGPLFNQFIGVDEATDKIKEGVWKQKYGQEQITPVEGPGVILTRLEGHGLLITRVEGHGLLLTLGFNELCRQIEVEIPKIYDRGVDTLDLKVKRMNGGHVVEVEDAFDELGLTEGPHEFYIEGVDTVALLLGLMATGVDGIQFTASSTPGYFEWLFTRDDVSKLVLV